MTYKNYQTSSISLVASAHELDQVKKVSDNSVRHTQTFFTLRAAAAFLQPFMPRKNANTWLMSDARSIPMIPFLPRGDEILYRWQDLLHFVVYVLGGAVRSTQPPVVGIIERRGEDRRQNVDRRYRKQITLTASVERRDRLVVERRSEGNRRKINK